MTDGHLVHPIVIRRSRTRYGGWKLTLRLYHLVNTLTFGKPDWAKKIHGRNRIKRIKRGVKWRSGLGRFQAEGEHQWVPLGGTNSHRGERFRCPACGHMDGRKAFRVREEAHDA